MVNLGTISTVTHAHLAEAPLVVERLHEGVALLEQVALVLGGDAARDVEAAVAADLLSRGDTKRSTTEIGSALAELVK